MATGLPGGIGIPHARSAPSPSPRSSSAGPPTGIDWGAKDGPATLVFLIAAPEGGGEAHMQMLAKLARALMSKDFKAALAAAPRPRPRSSHREATRSLATRRRPRAAGRRREAGPPAPLTSGRCRVAAGGRSRRVAGHEARRRHVVPDGHRPHLHGGRVARETPRRRPATTIDGRDPGLGRLDAARAADDRRGRRGDLRRTTWRSRTRAASPASRRRRRRQEGHLRRPRR